METEEQRQLQKEIDHLQKLIESNKNKSSEAAQQGVPRRPASAHPAVANNPHSSSAHSTYNPHRIVSYGHGFGRGRIERYRPPVHRNLSLVLNHPGGAAGPSSGAGDDTTSSLPKGFSTLASVGKPPPVHFRSSPPTPTRTPAPAAARSNHEVTIDGLRFCVVDGGSRLLRVVDNNADPTPATAVVAGVNFIRGNDGNLYKANVKAANSNSKTGRLCPRFTTTGLCPKGPSCRDIHDPNKLAICRDFLHKGYCPNQTYCNLSHDPSSERVPACVHFLKGHCTKDDCRYAHVHVNPAAPVCDAFATLGYCAKGSACTDRHVNECPDYANTGVCQKDKCRLPHVDRASRLRQTAAPTAASDSGEKHVVDKPSGQRDFESDEDDSDTENENAMMQETLSEGSHELSQQKDFVSL